jgi:hypothetical protein
VSLTFLTTEYSSPRPPTGPTFLTFARSQTVVFLGAPSNCMQGKQGWPVVSFLVVVDASSKEGDDDETCHAPATANPHRPTELPPALAHVDFINRLRQPPGRTTRTYPSLEREGVHDLTACFCCNSLVLPASKAGSLLPFFFTELLPTAAAQHGGGIITATATSRVLRFSRAHVELSL